MSQLKVLTIDIETTPITAYVWGLKDQNISLNQIVKDWQIMACGAKWLDRTGVWYDDTQRQTEKRLLEKIWAFLDNADILITQNGKSFDSRRLNARFIHYGMRPPSPYRHIDTYLLAKSAADFTSNKLEYLTDKLCKKYKKLSHSKFPGMSLWVECLKGNKLAWAEMRKYNINDVLSTEELYTVIKAWGPVNMPRLFTAMSICAACGAKAQRRGLLAGSQTKQRIHCTNPLCGRWGIEAVSKDKK